MSTSVNFVVSEIDKRATHQPAVLAGVVLVSGRLGLLAFGGGRGGDASSTYVLCQGNTCRGSMHKN